MFNSTPKFQRSPDVKEGGDIKLEKQLPYSLEGDKQEIVSIIKKSGLEANIELINEWHDKAEKWVEEVNDLQDQNCMIKVNQRLRIVSLAAYDFYIASGNIEDALEGVQADIDGIQFEGQWDLLDKAEEIKSKLIEFQKNIVK